MSRIYHVKEVYLTLQGEGAQTGKAAVFCRFAGCNLWSGREKDRANAACTFCDTDFVGTDGVGGGRFSAESLSDHLLAVWQGDGSEKPNPMVVFTGGEPALQLDEALIDMCQSRGFRVAIETNGTLKLPQGLDWVCVSPKSTKNLMVERGDELKLVYPQSDCPPEAFANLCFEHRFLQPMDGPSQGANIEAAIQYCLENPQWRLSLQTHKLIGID